MLSKIKTRYKIIIGLGLLLVINGVVNNYHVVTTNYQLSTDKITSGYKFVQISDFHSNSKTEQILKITTEANPDFILLTGDILEAKDMTETLEFIDQLTAISEVIYIRGNHEDDYGTYLQFKQELTDRGVIVLADQTYQVDNLNFIGLEDWSGANLGQDDYFMTEYANYIKLYNSRVKDGMYNILLAHRPNFLTDYSALGVDLVLSGHAHGGQWQLPFTDIGFVSPDDGFITTNVHGLKTQGETTQIISSGNSNPYGPWIPRLFNPEEVVVIDLQPESNPQS